MESTSEEAGLLCDGGQQAIYGAQLASLPSESDYLVNSGLACNCNLGSSSVFKRVLVVRRCFTTFYRRTLKSCLAATTSMPIRFRRTATDWVPWTSRLFTSTDLCVCVCPLICGHILCACVRENENNRSTHACIIVQLLSQWLLLTADSSTDRFDLQGLIDAMFIVIIKQDACQVRSLFCFYQVCIIIFLTLCWRAWPDCAQAVAPCAFVHGDTFR